MQFGKKLLTGSVTRQNKFTLFLLNGITTLKEIFYKINILTIILTHFNKKILKFWIQNK